MPRLGVLGWPVAHSRSPRCTTPRFAALGMTDWRYQRLPVPPELFAETVALPGRVGLRRRERDDPAQAGGARAGGPSERGGAAIGAANTLMFAPTARSPRRTPTPRA
jgi:shikimate dehydrogenase